MKYRTLIFMGLLLVLAAVGFAQDPEYPTPAPDMPGWLITLVGLAAPFVYQLVNKFVPTKAGRFWTAVGLSILVALIAALALGVFPTTAESAVTFAAWVFTFSQIAYQLFWKKLLEGPLKMKAVAKG